MNTNNTNIGAAIFRLLTSIDLVLIVSLILLISLGTAILFSATGENQAMMNNHTIHLIIATLAMLVASQIPSEMINRWSVWIYVIGVIVLILVLVQGSMGKGAQRWLEIGSLRFQPSEVMKLAVPKSVSVWMTAVWSFPPI